MLLFWNVCFIIFMIIIYSSNCQPFSSHNIWKLITKITWHTKNFIFFQPNKNKDNFDSFATAIALLLLSFGGYFYNLMEKRSVSLTKQIGIASFKSIGAHRLNIVDFYDGDSWSIFPFKYSLQFYKTILSHCNVILTEPNPRIFGINSFHFRKRAL